MDVPGGAVEAEEFGRSYVIGILKTIILKYILEYL